MFKFYKTKGVSCQVTYKLKYLMEICDLFIYIYL